MATFFKNELSTRFVDVLKIFKPFSKTPCYNINNNNKTVYSVIPCVWGGEVTLGVGCTLSFGITSLASRKDP